MLTPTFDISYSSTYPSEWMYGNVAGTIEYIRDKIRLRSPYCYQLMDYTKDNLQNTIDCLYKMNLDHAPPDKIKNRIRFISDELAEVELSMKKLAIIDRINLPKIFGYDLSVKEKKTKNGSQFYPMYCEKKIHKPLYQLFLDAETVFYQDDNPLNLVISNLGRHEDKFDVNANKTIVDIVPDMWLGGKYAGTIFCRSNDSAWNMVLKTDERSFTKYMKFDETNKQEKYDELDELRKKLSDDLGLTRNKFRFIGKDTIEVKLDHDQTFVTDSKFISIIDKYTLFVKKGGSNENAKYYVGMLDGKKTMNYHNFITGFNFVDHIDRNPMNNKLSNLREFNCAENNKNKTVGPKNYDPNYLCGVREIVKDGRKYIFTYVKNNSTQYTKLFSLKQYGQKKAIKLAISWRLNMLKEFNSNNWHENDIITLYDLPKLDPFFYNLTNYEKKLFQNNSNIVFNI
jgi:hypothetical protein